MKAVLLAAELSSSEKPMIEMVSCTCGMDFRIPSTWRTASLVRLREAPSAAVH